jgi:trk system potassium uptake protein
VTIAAKSPVLGKTLRSAGLPRGLLITSVTRGDTVFVPNGDTVLEVGDRLLLLGHTDEPEEFGQMVPFRTQASESTGIGRSGNSRRP